MGKRLRAVQARPETAMRWRSTCLAAPGDDSRWQPRGGVSAVRVLLPESGQSYSLPRWATGSSRPTAHCREGCQMLAKPRSPMSCERQVAKEYLISRTYIRIKILNCDIERARRDSNPQPSDP
jgi:hypothetical protein